MIYGVAELGDRSVVKIGFTSTHDGQFDENAIRGRLSAMQNGTWRQLAVIAVAEGNREEELRLHKMMFAYCVTREWFRNEGAVSVWVEDHALAKPITLQSRKVNLQDVNPRRSPVEIKEIEPTNFCSYCNKWDHQSWRCPSVLKQERYTNRPARNPRAVRELDEIARVSRVIRARADGPFGRSYNKATTRSAK